MALSDWFAKTFLTKTIDVQANQRAEEMVKAWKELPIDKKPAQPAQSVMYDPFSIIQALGYKDRPAALTYDTLRKMSDQLAVIGNIIQTRATQVASFSAPFRMTKTLGFMIKHKDTEHSLTKSEKKFILELEEYISNCGKGKNPHATRPRDDFTTFLKKIVADSLCMDQLAVEVVPDRKGLPFEFFAVDAGTIRIATDSIPSTLISEHNSRKTLFTPTVGYGSTLYRSKLDAGKKPAYVQVIRGHVENVYTEDELIFGVRNPRTSIYAQGYGYSELERIIATITSHLFAEEFNRRQFMNGSIPKGILNIKTEEYDQQTMENFKRQWLAQVASVENSWRTPVMNASGLEYINLTQSNRDAEFMAWMEYLIKISAGAYMIDPAEINFDFRGGMQQQPLFESPQENKIKNSKDRGLRPLLKFIASLINKGIIDKIDDHFYLDFVGLDEMSEEQKQELRKDKVGTFMTLNQIRTEEGMAPIEGGDIVLNPVYLQAVQMERNKALMEQQQAQAEAAGDGQGGISGDTTGAGDTQMHHQQPKSPGGTAATGKDKRLPGKDEDKQLAAPKDLKEGQSAGDTQVADGQQASQQPSVAAPGSRGPYKTSKFVKRHWNGNNWVYDYSDSKGDSHADTAEEAKEHTDNKVSHTVAVPAKGKNAAKKDYEAATKKKG